MYTNEVVHLLPGNKISLKTTNAIALGYSCSELIQFGFLTVRTMSFSGFATNRRQLKDTHNFDCTLTFKYSFDNNVRK